MRHIVYKNSDSYPVILLVKASAFNAQELYTSYTQTLVNAGIPEESIVFITLDYNESGKAPVKFIKQYLDQLLPEIRNINGKFIYCADANYFKVLAKQRKAEPHLGYSFPVGIEGYEDIQITLGVNHKSLLYNPANEAKLQLSVSAFVEQITGKGSMLANSKKSVIENSKYPKSYQEIKDTLEALHQYPVLSADIETFSLRFNEAGIATIAFAIDKHNGVAFACDYLPVIEPNDQEKIYGTYSPNKLVRGLLLNFFKTYKGKIRWQGANFDLKVLIYTLWMKDYFDTPGLLAGLDTLTDKFDDTKLITYLATNSCAGNKLGLKEQAHEYVGNWAQEDIKDVRKIPLDQLLEYNLIDCLATNYVYEKHYPTLIQDKQEEVYKELFLPSQKVITQIELEGLPLIPQKVAYARNELEGIVATAERDIQGTATIERLNTVLQTRAMESANAKLKTKQHPLSHFADVVFNPNSPQQKQILLYTLMGLPVIDYTDTKQPATGDKTLKKLLNHVTDSEHKKILLALRKHAKATKILTTFIVAFENAIDKGDGLLWLHGSFNLGGTKSGRLSSSDPNMQNIPSGSTFGKLIKDCFAAPKGWIFAGADFNSLEDYVSALTTRDPNKLKVYMGHTVYELEIDGVYHHIRDDAIVNYGDKTYTGEEFYALHRANS